MPKFIGWIPTDLEYINPFFELCPVSSSDVVYDLGSGDGRLLFAAVEKGAERCVGIDIDPDCVNVSREEAKSKYIEKDVTFVEADVMAVDLSEASVIFCYLYPTASAALRPKFEKELTPGTRVVMESFPVPGWKPAKVSKANGRSFYLYTMPPEKIVGYEDILFDDIGCAYDYDADGILRSIRNLLVAHILSWWGKRKMIAKEKGRRILNARSKSDSKETD